jgi:flagellar basal-body rod protein FlgB
MITRLSDGLDFQAQALNLRSERQRLLSSNIANADTPGYHARDLDFASALREATGRATPGMAGAAAVAALRQGNPAFGSATAASVETHLRYAAPSQSNLDGNTVDMDRERASFADNSVKYEATLRFINGHVRTMLDAMKSPQQG